MMWNLQRIKSDNDIIEEYGLKNMRELWMAQSEISRIRGNVRSLLSGSSSNANMEKDILTNLSKKGISAQNPTLDQLLDIKESAILERRLQSIVFRKGMARTMKQARQLITHGFIAINANKVNKPGYIVSKTEEDKISYYKPIEIQLKTISQAEGTEKKHHSEVKQEAPKEQKLEVKKVE